MAITTLSWLDQIFETPALEDVDTSTVFPRRGTLGFTGAGVTVSDDPTDDRTVVAISGGAVPSGIGFRFVNGGVETIEPINLSDITGTEWTGTLPAANQAPQSLSFPLGGTTAAPTVQQIPGILPVATGTGGTSQYLTAAQQLYQGLRLTGSPTSPVQILYSTFTADPNGAAGGVFVVVNATGQPATIGVVGSATAVTVPAGLAATLAIDNNGATVATSAGAIP